MIFEINQFEPAVDDRQNYLRPKIFLRNSALSVEQSVLTPLPLYPGNTGSCMANISGNNHQVFIIHS